jgi:hypothetical protein
LDEFVHEINAQSTPFAVFCVSMESTDSSEKCTCWLDSFLSAIDKGISSDVVIYTNSSLEVTALLKSCAKKEAGQLSRVVRTLLMIDYPSIKPHFSTVVVKQKNTSALQVLNQAREKLEMNIAEHSSRVEIRLFNSKR